MRTTKSSYSHNGKANGHRKNDSGKGNENGRKVIKERRIETIPTTEEPAESFETVYLDPTLVHFCHEGENLTYTASDGLFYPRVTLMRCFPMSAQNSFISVRTPDQEMERGVELGILEDYLALDEPSRTAVAHELRLHYFVPTIHSVLNIREEFGFLYWTVKTDRGDKEFIMRDSLMNATRQISKFRWLIIDINQTRYEINDIEKLDLKSRQLLERHLLL
jgi:hypothetical protein